MKRIVIYYSYSGNTEKIAKMIANKLGCDILALEPSVPFSSNYDEVVNEYQNNSINENRVDIKPININLSEYDGIILGTCVWWYTICPVITTFLKENDLEAKIIYPFATNAGWLGRTFTDIKKLCPYSEVKDGFDVVFSSSNINELKTSLEEIEKWIGDIK